MLPTLTHYGKPPRNPASPPPSGATLKKRSPAYRSGVFLTTGVFNAYRSSQPLVDAIAPHRYRLRRRVPCALPRSSARRVVSAPCVASSRTYDDAILGVEAVAGDATDVGTATPMSASCLAIEAANAHTGAGQSRRVSSWRQPCLDAPHAVEPVIPSRGISWLPVGLEVDIAQEGDQVVTSPASVLPNELSHSLECFTVGEALLRRVGLIWG